MNGKRRFVVATFKIFKRTYVFVYYICYSKVRTSILFSRWHLHIHIHMNIHITQFLCIPGLYVSTHVYVCFNQ